MMPRLRLRSSRLALATLPLLAAALVGSPAPAQDGQQPAANAASADSAESCAKCHADFYQEWHGRAHNMAWVDPIYQEALKEKERPNFCWGCHIPAEVQERVGRKPRPRDENRDEGVNCIACHRSEGVIQGPFGVKTDAHPSAENDLFKASSPELCNSCHETKIGPVLPVGRDWRDVYSAKLGDKAKRCVDCHMPEIERTLAVDPETGKPVGDKRKTRSHKVYGPHDPDFVAKAFDISVAKDGASLAVKVENHAGHRVPGLRIRRFVMHVRQLDDGGKELAAQEVVFDGEQPLDVLETRQISYPLASGATKVAITIDHELDGKKVATVVDEEKKL